MFEKVEIFNTCISCDICRILCPESAICSDGVNYAVDTWSCTNCGICELLCPVDAIKFKKE